jgi:uncharacterized protein (TIGR03435 family)
MREVFSRQPPRRDFYRQLIVTVVQKAQANAAIGIGADDGGRCAAQQFPSSRENHGVALYAEARELAVYSLVIAKTGSKLKEANLEDIDKDPDAIRGPDGHARTDIMSMSSIPGGTKWRGQAVSMRLLAMSLYHQVGRIVVDNTGLTGNYNFSLQFTPDLRSLAPSPSGDATGASPSWAPDPNGATIFTAIEEQLGLKLEATKGAVEVIVIDHIERPSEN